MPLRKLSYHTFQASLVISYQCKTWYEVNFEQQQQESFSKIPKPKANLLYPLEEENRYNCSHNH